VNNTNISNLAVSELSQAAYWSNSRFW